MTNDAIVNYLNDLIKEWWNKSDCNLFGRRLVEIANSNFHKEKINYSYTLEDDVFVGELNNFNQEMVICDGIFLNEALVIDFYPYNDYLICSISEVRIKEDNDEEELYIFKKLKLVIKDVVKYLKVFVNNYDFKNDYSDLVKSLVQFTLDYMLNSKQEVFNKKTFWSDYE